MKDLVIVGTGGFSGEVLWLVERINEITPTWNVLGFIDNDVSKDGVVGNDDFVCNYAEDLNVVIAIGAPGIRKKLYEKYKRNEKVSFPTLMDPSVIISAKNKIGVGNIICAGNIITVGIEIGDFNIINLDCTIGHSAVLKDYITLNPSINISGDVFIGTETTIGTGAQILQGIKIGHGTIVGAGAVVNKDLPDNCTAVGLPAKVIKYHKT